MRRDRELTIKKIVAGEQWGPAKDEYGKMLEAEHNRSLERAVRKAYTAGRNEKSERNKKHDRNKNNRNGKNSM